jgi:proliferating cell nuclear antigen PCNA
MYMRVQIKDSKKFIEWCELFKFINKMNQHITILFKPNEVYIQIMDGAHVCLIDITIPSSWFDLYENDDTTTIGLVSAIFVKIFGMYTKDSVFELELLNENDKLNIHFYNTTQNKHFEVTLMDIEQDILSPSLIETNLDFNIKSTSFDKYINELGQFGDEVVIRCSDEKLFFETRGDDGQLQIELEGDTLEEFNVVENYVFTARFPIKYLSIISKFSVNYPHVHLFLDEENPVRITFDNTEIKFNYFLAPKMEG